MGQVFTRVIAEPVAFAAIVPLVMILGRFLINRIHRKIIDVAIDRHKEAVKHQCYPNKDDIIRSLDIKLRMKELESKIKGGFYTPGLGTVISFVLSLTAIIINVLLIFENKNVVEQLNKLF